jgi:hypothetical protein
MFISLIRKFPTVPFGTFIVLIYFFTWGPSLLFLDAVFWDDWLYLNNYLALEKHFQQAGFPWIGWVHVNVLLFRPQIYHLIGFLSFLLSSLLLLKILEKVNIKGFVLTRINRFTLVLFFTIFPINFARHSMNVTQYSFCLFIFFMSWYLFIRRIKLNVLEAIIICILFAVSFNLNSLLVFYLIPLMHRIHNVFNISNDSKKNQILKETPFIVLPVVWYLIKSTAYSPFGFYQGYNGLTVVSLIKLVSLFIFAVMFGLCLRFYVKRNALSNTAYFLIFGVVLFSIALTPYWVVGKSLLSREWETRNTILLPLGIAFFLTGVLNVLKEVVSNLVLSKIVNILIVSVLSLTTIYNNLEFSRDWSKQKIILEWMDENLKAYSSTLVMIEDRTMHLNALNRDYRFFEWIGMSRSSVNNLQALIVEERYANELLYIQKIDREIKLNEFYYEYLSFSNLNSPKQYDLFMKLDIIYTCNNLKYWMHKVNKNCFQFNYYPVPYIAIENLMR